MKYLENPICDFETEFKVNLDNKKNIISLSFFKMYHGGYKDFGIYIDGFMNLHKAVLEEKKYKFTIRLFIDNSIRNDTKLFSRLNNLERVEIIVYSCEKYFDINDDYHIGLFGTLVRFFPIFDFPNNDANIIILADMDDAGFFNENVDMLERLSLQDKNKVYMITYGNLSRSVKFQYEMEQNGHIRPYCIAPKYIFLKRIDKKIFLDYYKNYGDTNVKQIIRTYGYKLKDLNNKLKLHKNFIYGTDENFLNYYLVPYIIDNNLSYVLYVDWSLSTILYYYSGYRLERDTTQNKKLSMYVVEYLLSRLGIKFNHKDNFRKKYKIIDDILYGRNEELKLKLQYYYYKMFLYFYGNTNYRYLYPKELYNLIKKYNLFGIYELEIMIVYGGKNTDDIKIEFIKKKVFDNDKLKELKDFSTKYAKIFI